MLALLLLFILCEVGCGVLAQDLRVDPADNLNLKAGIYDGAHDAVPQLRRIYNFRPCHSCNYYFSGSYVCETDFLVIELVLDSK